MPNISVTTRKFVNWRAYFEGMYVKSIQASTGAFLAFAGSNTAEAVAPTSLSGLGLSWKQAVVAAVSALVFEVIRYVNAKPLPDADTLPPIPPA